MLRPARAAVPLSLLALLCAPRPASPSPSKAARPRAPAKAGDAPIPLRIGKTVSFSLETPVDTVHGFRLAATADVVLTWTKGTIAATSPEGVHEDCDASPCVLPLAAPGAHRLVSDGDPPGAPVQVDVRALPRPSAAPLRVSTPVIVTPAKVAPDDPRGALADLALDVSMASAVELVLRPRDARPGEGLARLSQRLPQNLHGSRGPQMAVATASATGDALVISAELPAGAYVLRLGDTGGVAVEVTLRSLRADPQVTARPSPAASPPGLPALEPNGNLTISVGATPAPRVTWLTVERGGDLVVEWTSSPPVSTVMSLEYRSKNASGGHVCSDPPCIEEHVDSGRYGVSLMPKDAPVAVRASATLLPRLPVTAQLIQDRPLIVSTRRVSPDDPRGAVAELSFEVARPGAYRFTARILDGWKVDTTDPRWFEHPSELALIRVYHARTGDLAHGPSLLMSTDAYRDGISVEIVNLETPGRYLVRLDGDMFGARAEPRRYEVTVVRTGDVTMP